jgi:hypothetical protein
MHEDMTWCSLIQTHAYERIWCCYNFAFITGQLAAFAARNSWTLTLLVSPASLPSRLQGGRGARVCSRIVAILFNALLLLSFLGGTCSDNVMIYNGTVAPPPCGSTNENGG